MNSGLQPASSGGEPQLNLMSLMSPKSLLSLLGLMMLATGAAADDQPGRS